MVSPPGTNSAIVFSERASGAPFPASIALKILGSNTGMSISVWDDRASADTCSTKADPEVLKKLDPVLEGTPRVDTYETILAVAR